MTAFTHPFRKYWAIFKAQVVFILGGLLISLDFFRDWLRSIALSLPFAYTVYGPTRLFVDPRRC